MSALHVDPLRQELILGKRRIPLNEIHAVELEAVNPDLRLAFLGLLVGVLGIPALNVLGAAPARQGLAAAGVVVSSLLIFWGIHNLIGAGDRYRVCLQLEQRRQVALVTGDPDLATRVLTDLRKALDPLPDRAQVPQGLVPESCRQTASAE